MVVVALGAAEEASAANGMDGRGVYDANGDSVDLVLFTDGGGAARVTSLASCIAGTWFFRPSWVASGSWTFLHTSGRAVGDAAPFESGNGYVAVHRLIGRGAARVSLGGGASLPAASRGEPTPPERFATTPDRARGPMLAAAARGNWNFWLTSVRVMAFTAEGHLEVDATDWLTLGVDVVPAALVTLRTGEVDVAIQAAPTLEVGSELVTVGLRAQALWLPTVAAGDVQLSAQPYVEVSVLDTALTASLLVNLEGPSGFSFADGGVWGASLGWRTAL